MRLIAAGNNGSRVRVRDTAVPGVVRATPWSNLRGKTVRDNYGMRRRDVMPGIKTGNFLPPPNVLTSFGWMGQALADMGNASAWADSLNTDNEIVIPSGFPLEAMASSPASLLNACLIACAGNGVKNYGALSIIAGTAAIGGPGGTIVGGQQVALQAAATQVFGVRVRISNALTAYKFASYEIVLTSAVTVAAGNTTYIAGNVLGYVIVQVASLPVDIIILSITNTAGKATVVGTPTPFVVMPFTPAGTALASANPFGAGYINQGGFVVGDVVYAETLNMRDIGNIETAVSSGAIKI
jgi:hypothetical protein